MGPRPSAVAKNRMALPALSLPDFDVPAWARAALRVAPAVVLAALFIVTGLRGIDFGFHWDEDRWWIAPIREMVDTGLFLPRASIYPSFAKWLVLLPAIPSGLYAVLTGHDVRA